MTRPCKACGQDFECADFGDGNTLCPTCRVPRPPEPIEHIEHRPPGWEVYPKAFPLEGE